MRHAIPFILLFWITVSCQNPKELSPEKYVQWISSEDHGCIKTKSIKNIDIQVRYLPSEYLAYKEFSSSDNIVSFDSIWNSYKCGLTFQVTLAADKSDLVYGNLMYYQVATQEDIQARIRYLSFNIQEFISLKHGETTYEPVLSHFEGFDQLGNRVSFQVAFIVPEYNCASITPAFDNITLTWDDPYWDVGTNHFQFDKEELTTLPKLRI